MIVEAWLDSANTPIGYPMVNVRDIESGKIRATRELFGADWLFRSRGQPSAGETQLQDTRHNRKTRKQRTGFVRCRRRDMQTLGRLRSANQVYVSTVFHAELKPVLPNLPGHIRLPSEPMPEGQMSQHVERQCDIGAIVNRLTFCGYHVGLQTYEGGLRVWMCDRLYSHCVEHFVSLPPNPGLGAIERRTAEAAV